jgi:hypothetical protein
MRINKRKIYNVKYGGNYKVKIYNNYPYRCTPRKRVSTDPVYELDDNNTYIYIHIPKYMIVKRCGKMIYYYYSDKKQL